MSKNDESLFTIQPSDWADFSLQLSNETDRGSTLVGSSFLENRLGALIESFLLEKPKLTKELLTGPLAPLSSFYSRILAAYLLGLISEEENNDLDVIRSIRNDFAHSHKALGFSSPTISKKYRNFVFRSWLLQMIVTRALLLRNSCLLMLFQ